MRGNVPDAAVRRNVSIQYYNAHENRPAKVTGLTTHLRG